MYYVSTAKLCNCRLRELCYVGGMVASFVQSIAHMPLSGDRSKPRIVDMR